MLGEQALRARPTRWRAYWRSLMKNRTALVGIVALILIVFCALAAPLIAPHDPQAQDITLRLHPPAWQARGNWSYPLGNDALGRDVLSRVIYGARISLLVGIAAVVVQGFLGTALGLLAGFYGGKIDSIIMRITDVQYALPFLVLALAVMAVLGPSLRNVILVLGITGWVYYARIVRAEVLSVRQREFIEAATAIGATGPRLMIRHVLPNVTASIIVIASLQVARMIISEASLSFLGMGIPPEIPSWGGMVAEGRSYVATAWWVSAFSGAAILITVMSVNLVGDWLRDELDPTLKGERSSTS
jgi:ABC-type dipeptide/oligopeptide/nickel transport system permease subunit